MSLWPRRVRLRRLKAGDAAPWRDLRREALATHPEAFGETHDDWAGRPLTDVAAHLEDHYVLGAFRKGGLIGTMALDCTSAGGEIFAVFIRADQRGKGTGRALLTALGTEARRRGVPRLVLAVAQDNDRAMRFYQRAGFGISGPATRALSRDGRLLDLVTMTKAL